MPVIFKSSIHGGSYYMKHENRVQELHNLLFTQHISLFIAPLYIPYVHCRSKGLEHSNFSSLLFKIMLFIVSLHSKMKV